jgi:hypothetical protein
MSNPTPSNPRRDELEDTAPTERMHRSVIVAALDEAGQSWAPVAMDSAPVVTALRPSSPTFIIDRRRLGRARRRGIGPTLALLTVLLVVGSAVGFGPRARLVVVRALTTTNRAEPARPMVPRVPHVSSARAADYRHEKTSLPGPGADTGRRLRVATVKDPARDEQARRANVTNSHD